MSDDISARLTDDRDATLQALEEAGVHGSAVAAVHDLLVRCEPNDACARAIHDAVLVAGRALVQRCGSPDGASPRAAAALLAVLDRLGEEPLPIVATILGDRCGAQCRRRGPGGGHWHTTMSRVRDELIGGDDGGQLVLEATVAPALGPVVTASWLPPTAEAKEGGPTPAPCVVPPEAVRDDFALADRLAWLARLAIVRRLGGRIGAGPHRPRMLRITGLRVRGHVRVWSALHDVLTTAS